LRYGDFRQILQERRCLLIAEFDLFGQEPNQLRFRHVCCH